MDIRLLPKRPEDIPMLDQWGRQAFEEGDMELAKLIAQRVAMIENAYSGGYDPDEEEGPVDKFLIGMGRGAMDTIQGAKQKALMLRDMESSPGAGQFNVLKKGMELLFGDEERTAEEYTRDLSDEIGQFEEDFPGIGPESFGRFAGWAAPAAAAAPSGIGATAAVGALEGFLQPTEEASFAEAGKNAAIGGVTAGALSAVPYAYRAYQNMMRGPVKEGAEDALRLADKAGAKMRPGQIVDSPITNIMDDQAADTLAGNVSRSRVEDDVRKVEDYISDQYPRSSVGEGYRTGQQNFRQMEKEAWQPVDELLEGVNFNKFHVRNTIINDIISDMRKNNVPQSVIDEMAEWGRTVLKGGEKWSDLKNLRSNIGLDPMPLSGGSPEQWSTRSNHQKWFDRLYGEVSEYMKDVADKVDARGAVEDAIDFSKQLNQLERQAGVQRSVRSGQIQRDSVIENIVKGSDKDRNAALSQILSSEGVDGAKNILVESMIDSPNPLRQFKRMERSLPNYFAPDEIAELRGYAHFMDLVEKDLKKGEKGVTLSLVGQAVAPAVGAAVGGTPGAITVAAVQQGIVPALMRRQGAKELMQKLGSVKPESKYAGLIYDRLISSLATGSGTLMVDQGERY